MVKIVKLSIMFVNLRILVWMEILLSLTNLSLHMFLNHFNGT